MRGTLNTLIISDPKLAGTGPAVNTAIWHLQLGSGGEQSDPELAVRVRLRIRRGRGEGGVALTKKLIILT